MKKLLFITAFPPNNKSGGQTFSLNLLKDLSGRYVIDLICSGYKDHDIDKSLQLNSITTFKPSYLNSLLNFTRHPIFTRRFNRKILNYIKTEAKNHDILFFDYSQVGIYSLYIEHPYKVIRCHDILFQKFSRKGKVFRPWIKSTERRILQNVNKIFVATNKDVGIVQNIYNLNSFYSHEYIKNFVPYEFDTINKVFVFFGIWSRPENADGLKWFIKKVLPCIDINSRIKFVVIGGGLSVKIKKKYIDCNKNIEYLGFVDDPLKIIYESCALIAPLFAGAGVKVKVIDAFTTGTPVIGSEIAFEGLPHIENLVYLANRPQEYAEIINSMVNYTSEEKRELADSFRAQYDNSYLHDKI